ncbi:DUF928 domain-containing protein [Leptolyngbyaceae cyanobacterium CCMR0082]|uniref:DUF928 domain-containing protein n=2 Tax=Adonisia TaxID=2950183 RepID=A0A6M0S6P5_9CYAN|nr:DUF928 domain-containing protein [Adonisia turfae CCMR0082]
MQDFSILKSLNMPFLPLGSRLTRITCLALISTIVGSSMSAIAAYMPSEDTKAPEGPTLSGGRRGGCDDASALDLLALAPQHLVGQTLTTQPTLVWYVPDAKAYNVQLNLYQYTGEGWADIVEGLDIGLSTQGYMSYTVPATLELEIGSVYEWQIVLTCIPDRPSSAQVTGAQFEVVSRPIDLSAVDGNRVQQAQEYAIAGLWYDAMALLSDPLLTPEENDYRRELLTSLAEFEDVEIGAQLRQISAVD